MKKVMSLAAAVVGVVALAAAGRACCLPEDEGGYVKVHFLRTPGVGDFRTHRALDLNGDDLNADEVKQLRKLIEDANFFELKSSHDDSRFVPPDPPAGYDLTIGMDGRTHSVWVADGDVTASLKPLVDCLTAREEEQPAVRVEFTKSGGIAGLQFPTTTIDGTTLSPEDAEKLSPEDAEKLSQLIADAHFFDLKDDYPTHGADLFAYTNTVEMCGRLHTVGFSDDSVPEERKPLFDWLSGQGDGIPVGCGIPA